MKSIKEKPSIAGGELCAETDDGDCDVSTKATIKLERSRLILMIARIHISTGFMLFVLVLTGCSDQQSNQKEAEVKAKETEVSGRVQRLLARMENRPPAAELQKALSKVNLEKTGADGLGRTW